MHKTLHGLVCRYIVAVRVMKQHHIHITDIQSVQAGLDGCFGVGHFSAGVDFGDYKDFFPLDAQFHHALPNRLADRLLVAIGGGGVNEAHAALQRGFHGVDALVPVQAVGSQAVDGHGISAVERHGAGAEIKGTGIRKRFMGFSCDRLRLLPAGHLCLRA